MSIKRLSLGGKTLIAGKSDARLFTGGSRLQSVFIEGENRTKFHFHLKCTVMKIALKSYFLFIHILLTELVFYFIIETFLFVHSLLLSTSFVRNGRYVLENSLVDIFMFHSVGKS